MLTAEQVNTCPSCSCIKLEEQPELDDYGELHNIEGAAVKLTKTKFCSNCYKAITEVWVCIKRNAHENDKELGGI